MTNNYALLKQIIDFFEEYEQQEEQVNLLDFSNWIISKLSDDANSNKPSVKKNSAQIVDGIQIGFAIAINDYCMAPHCDI